MIVGDPRSEEIFWKGLKSSNIGVAFLGASGLGILGKTNAIEKIEACASTLPAGAARLLAVSFLEFSDARAYAAFAKYYPDPKMREGMRDILSVGRIRASMRAK